MLLIYRGFGNVPYLQGHELLADRLRSFGFEVLERLGAVAQLIGGETRPGHRRV